MQILETQPVITEKRIHGIALVPRISRNENLYTKKELARAHGVQVPLNWEHTDKVIGSVTFTYDEEFNQVKYEGDIFDFALPLVRGKEVFASIEARPTSERAVCNESDDCFNMPQGLRFEGLALTLSPGVPETSAIVAESCPKAEKSYIYTHRRAVEMNDPVEPAGTEKPAVTTADGQQVFDDGTVEAPNQEKTVTAPAPTPAREADAPNMDGGDDDDDKTERKSEMDHGGDDDKDKDMAETVKKAVAEAMASYTGQTEKSIVEQLKRFHSTPVFGNQGFSPMRLYEGLRATGSATWFVPITGYERLPSPEGVPSLTEAISFTPANGNSSQVVTSDRIFVQPSGKFARSIRHLTRFKEIPDGTDTIKELRTGVVSAGTVTEGSTNTDVSNTIHSVSLSADTITGITQTIKMADVEDTAGDIIGALTEQARIEAMDAEAKLVFDDAANAISAANIGAWIDNDGDTITDDDVTGLGEFSYEALLEARRYFENEGYPTAPGELKCVVDPRALRELRGDSNIQRYVQEGDAMITRTGALAQLFGIDLLPSNKVHETSGHSNKNAYRNIVFSPESAFLLGSKRDVQINMLYQPNKFAYEWSWSHRKNATAFDPKAIVRISSEVPT